MNYDYNLRDLEEWEVRISALAQDMGLNCYAQEFDICDNNQMLGYIAYSGMPTHYPHWSYGKAFERQKTLYDHGLVGLPYEMVINANPSLAYLMKDNSLLLQILTMAHVYGHNDFFKNNLIFGHSYPEYTLEMFKAHADRIRSYIEDPSIGLAVVENTLDAAHALSLNCSRYLGIKKLTVAEQRQRILERSQPKKDEFSGIHARPEYIPPDLTKTPLEPEEDILLFIRDHNPYLTDWQRDILTIVAEETQYFLPQMETKIMNEGWATYWHHQILNVLELPQDFYLEFLVRHNQVIRPVPGGLNPYYLGFKIFQDIEKRWGVAPGDLSPPRGQKEGREKLFQVRETDRDVSFLRQYLTEDLMRELGLFRHEKKGEDRVVSHISDKEDWQVVKETLLKNVGLSAVPVIKILDANFKKQQALFLLHEHDGRELDIAYAQQSLIHLHSLWQRKVIIQTKMNNQLLFLTFDGEGAVKSNNKLD